MSENKFKAVLQKILSDAVEQNRETLLNAFAPLIDDATARQIDATQFQTLAWRATNEVFNTTLHSTLMGHTQERLDRLITERLAEPEIQEMIHTQVRTWLASEDFTRLITERTAMHLRALLAARVPPDEDWDE